MAREALARRTSDTVHSGGPRKAREKLGELIVALHFEDFERSFVAATKLDGDGNPIFGRDGKPKMMLASVTVAGRYANLRTIVRAAHKLGLCSDFVSAVEPPQVREMTTNYLRAEQARALFEVFPSVSPQWIAMLYLLRCRPDLNRGMVVLQTTALPLGYGTEFVTMIYRTPAGGRNR